MIDRFQEICYNMCCIKFWIGLFQVTTYLIKKKFRARLNSLKIFKINAHLQADFVTYINDTCMTQAFVLKLKNSKLLHSLFHTNLCL